MKLRLSLLCANACLSFSASLFTLHLVIVCSARSHSGFSLSGKELAIFVWEAVGGTCSHSVSRRLSLGVGGADGRRGKDDIYGSGVLCIGGVHSTNGICCWPRVSQSLSLFVRRV